MNTRNQLLLTHSAIPMALIIFVGSFVMTGWLPPPSPSLSAAEVAAVFTPDNVMLRIGVLLMCLFCPLVIAFSAVIATQLKRCEGKHHTLANLQLASQAAGLALFYVPGFLWLAISYRTGTPPEIIVVLNDAAWFMFLAGAGPTILQWACIGLAILSDKSATPVYPRWLGYLHLWLALGAFSGQVIPFVKTGPFAYNGLFGFWIVATVFFIWVTAAYLWTLKAVKNQARQQSA